MKRCKGLTVAACLPLILVVAPASAGVIQIQQNISTTALSDTGQINVAPFLTPGATYNFSNGSVTFNFYDPGNYQTQTSSTGYSYAGTCYPNGYPQSCYFRNDYIDSVSNVNNVTVNIGSDKQSSEAPYHFDSSRFGGLTSQSSGPNFYQDYYYDRQYGYSGGFSITDILSAAALDDLANDLAISWSFNAATRPVELETITFSATAMPVPEPNSGVLLAIAIALAGVAAASRRQSDPAAPPWRASI